MPIPIVLRVKRYDPERRAFGWSEYKLEVDKRTTVLDMLLRVKAYHDASLSFRYSCRMGICGSCGMVINGVPRLACQTKPPDLGIGEGGGVITAEPLWNLPNVRDLVVDFGDFFERHRTAKPYLIRADVRDQFENLDSKAQYLQRPEQLELYAQFSYCIKCGLCYSACPEVATNLKFLGPQALAQATRYCLDNRDEGFRERLKIVDGRHGVFGCHFAGSCSTVCPKGVDPALAIQLLRGMTFRRSRKAFGLP